MTNTEIAGLLRKVAAAFVVKDEKKYRFQIIAYQRAADAIQSTTSQVKDLLKDNKLDELPGVGPSIKQHLEELIKTGKVKHFETIMKDVPDAMFPLLEVPSFGPKKAYRLVTTFHLTNPKTVIQEVNKLAQSGKIAPLEGFGDKSQSDITQAIEEFGKGAGKTTRMLLPFATELAEKLVKFLLENPHIKDAQPLGSLRRESPTVGDLDIAISSDKPQEATEYFTKYPYKQRVIEKGPASASLLTSGGQQVDLMVRPTKDFGSLLQHFTGSKHHNVHLREYALSKGLSISEYGLKHLKTGKIDHFTSEEKFYNALGMDWIPPELREDTGEIEAALKHQLPKLITLQDMKGDLHIHSSYNLDPSHDLGMNTMEEMLLKAQELGYEYLAFSEHNPSVSKHTKNQIYSILEKRKEKIEKLKESNKNIRVINLLEVDILVSGELAIDDKAFEYLDGAIVSIHSSFGMDEKKMTERVLRGLSHPKAKILAHPTGRLIGKRSGYTLNFEKIFDYAKEHKKALEINSWPERLDLPDTLIKQAKTQGVKMVIDTDSHATAHMDLMRYGIALARRGWAEKSDILNTLEYNKFKEWLES